MGGINTHYLKISYTNTGVCKQECENHSKISLLIDTLLVKRF